MNRGTFVKCFDLTDFSSPRLQKKKTSIAPKKTNRRNLQMRVAICNRSRVGRHLACGDHFVLLSWAPRLVHHATWPAVLLSRAPPFFSHFNSLLLIPAGPVEHLVHLVGGFDFAAQWVSNSHIPTLPRNVGWRGCFTMSWKSSLSPHGYLAPHC